MLKSRKNISFVCISVAIFSVLLSINLPIVKETVGALIFSTFNYKYNTIYSVIFLIGSLGVFSLVSKNIEDINLNRFKKVLSFTIFLALASSILI
ncbi:hypothetical protein LZ906_016980 (plasmid) [Paraclostridium ghonii]|uniref:hypothetical protein n=1 Tax=Paraclostridium ghonii TaxID=29358 RepID=UPI00202CC9F3|nr:hypothetical protein [Paeniclostridium ghonii]MCM0167178.1 hypothetical protein [Paeniclostridium ghonii]